MPVRVVPDSPLAPASLALLEAGHAFSSALYPPEENFVLSPQELCAPDILFFTARAGDVPVGTIALRLEPDHAEIKAMFVSPEARGQGVAGALLARAEAEARARALPWLRLETGPKNHDAMRLYVHHGFERSGPFGGYADIPASVFMAKRLDAVAPRQAVAGDMPGVHALLRGAFAYMEGVIDPPSSMNRMTLDDLQREAEKNEVWVIGVPAQACMILTDKGETLYLGKLAVAAEAQGQGLSRRLVAQAAARARALGRPTVTLQTRVELLGNQAAFARMGFVETGRSAHPGYARPTSITYSLSV